jgi:tetratricopeptide (TPR) repeat protein
VLLLGMFRPEFQPPWTGQPHVTMLTLGRLDRRDTAAMVANLAGNSGLPPGIAEEIAERTDGVPLFVEELTKAVLESGAHGAAALSSVPHPAFSVPATLHASLMARLDRLGLVAKEVAQIGAAIGREFGYGLLAASADLPAPQLHDALGRLTSSGLLLVRGMPPEASYIFKHALVQDAAYGTLLRGRRQLLHSRIAAILEDRFPEIVLAQPALLAQHCESAGLGDQAVAYRLKAGQQGIARSAMTEAVGQLRKGLDVLAGLPDSGWRLRQELDLQTELGFALSAAAGWSAGDVGDTFNRALALAERLDRPEYLVPVMMGQWGFHCVRAEHRLALPLAEQLEQIGEARNDAATMLLGRHAHGQTRLNLGDFIAARHVLERPMSYAERTHRPVSFDMHAAVLADLALTLAHLGYIDQARSRMDDALSRARRHNHAFTLVHILVSANALDRLTRLPELHLEEFLALTTENHFPHYSGWALAFRGRSLIGLGQTDQGLALLLEALGELRAVGGVTSTPILFTWLAQAYATLGRRPEALNCFAEAARIVESTDERFAEAELIHRLPGDLLNDAGNRLAAEQHYFQAFAVAERQSAKLFQLRASTSLAQLWRDQGKRTEACALLSPIYSWFTEGFDAPDLKDAKALLEQLKP